MRRRSAEHIELAVGHEQERTRAENQSDENEKSRFGFVKPHVLPASNRPFLPRLGLTIG
jgi:hypothetical protein